MKPPAPVMSTARPATTPRSAVVENTLGFRSRISAAKASSAADEKNWLNLHSLTGRGRDGAAECRPVDGLVEQRAHPCRRNVEVHAEEQDVLAAGGVDVDAHAEAEEGRQPAGAKHAAPARLVDAGHGPKQCRLAGAV